MDTDLAYPEWMLVPIANTQGQLIARPGFDRVSRTVRGASPRSFRRRFRLRHGIWSQGTEYREEKSLVDAIGAGEVQQIMPTSSAEFTWVKHCSYVVQAVGAFKCSDETQGKPGKRVNTRGAPWGFEAPRYACITPAPASVRSKPTPPVGPCAPPLIEPYTGIQDESRR